MMRRPRPGEDEDDILKMQEEFLRLKRKENLQPAAQVVDLRSQPTTSAQPAGCKRSASDANVRKPSKYAQAKGLTNRMEKIPRYDSPDEILDQSNSDYEVKPQQDSNKVEPEQDNNKPEQDDRVYFPKVIPFVMGNIVEKNVTSLESNRSLPPAHAMPIRGFPTVKKCDRTISTGAKSIFAQQMEREKSTVDEANTQVMEVDQVPNYKEDAKPTTSALNVPSKSFIVTSEDADSIHKQNIEMLHKMSEKEILEEQGKLLANLDPELIKFVKSRREKPANSREIDIKKDVMGKQESDNSLNAPENSSSTSKDEDVIPDILWENDILSHPDFEKWVNFNSLEKDKLEWMKGIEESTKLNGDEPYEARFDFTGYLLPYTVEYNEQTKTLFHHGEESHRPGYSLLELIELTRSSIIQQRTMALNTIAGILEHYSTGIYKDIIDIPLTKIFFVIRFSMDENKASILEPALRAMRNLLFNRVDEACLDALLGLEEGLRQPCLEHDKSEIADLDSKESELKDYHLAEIDLITGALRTDILRRIEYILAIVKPTFNCVQYCLQILTRLVRDSVESALKIINSGSLMTCIVQNFVQAVETNFPFDASIVYNGKPVLAAVKFIRVLSLQSAEIGKLLVTKYCILKPVAAYIASNAVSTYGLRLQTEAFAILINLLSHGVGNDCACALMPVVTMSLYKHVNETNINSSVAVVTYASIIVQFVCKIFLVQVHDCDQYKMQIYPLIKQGIMKWITQLSSSDVYTCGHLRLLCATLDCVKTIVQIEGPNSLADGELKNILKKFAGSNGFKMIITQLIPCSNLLSNIDSTQLHSTKNLSNLGGTVVNFKGKVLPVLSFTSPLPFLTSLAKLLDCMNDPATAMVFVNQMWPYLAKIKTEVPFLSENWFTRIETDFLFHLLRITTAKNDFNESEKDLLYAVANKMCYILRADRKEELNFLFQNIVFNKHWFTAERLLNLISLTDTNMFRKTLNSIDEIRLCYSKVINLSFRDTGPSVILRNWQEPILPRDWIYLPIVKLYSEHQEMQNVPKVHGIHARKVAALKTAEKEFIVGCCLEWILFNELCFVNLIKDIDITDRFCRLMCIFLCDNSVFLETNIKILLEKCVEVIFEKAKKSTLNFDKNLTGLHNFQDFYTQFLEQFQAVSYGDYTFAACVLVPLAQKHNVKWRKLVWSEYAGCLRALDCPEEKLCYDIDDYLYPDETDESLVKSYLHALSTNVLRANTISFKIATHHVNSFRKKKIRLNQQM